MDLNTWLPTLEQYFCHFTQHSCVLDIGFQSAASKEGEVSMCLVTCKYEHLLNLSFRDVPMLKRHKHIENPLL